MPRSAWSVELETYHGASTIIRRILDWLLWFIDVLNLLAQPHNSRPYVQLGMIMALKMRILFSTASFHFLPISQFICLMVKSISRYMSAFLVGLRRNRGKLSTEMRSVRSAYNGP
jgi:hypothetical protein